MTESVNQATLPPAATIDIPDSFANTLDGTVGTFPVRVRLSRERGRLSGEYIYETSRSAIRTVVEVLSLDGSIDADGMVRLDETASDSSGKSEKTGAFEGTLTNTTLGLRFVGTWKKADGSSELPVVLSELTTTPGGVRFVSTTLPSPDRRLSDVVTVRYPKAEGGDSAQSAAMSSAVESFIRDRVREFTTGAVENLGEYVTVDMLALQIDYEIAVATDEIVCIVFTEYANFGGAHPVSAVYARTYDFSRARFLTLADIGGDTRSLVGALSQKCRALAPKDDLFSTGLEPVAENFQEWYVTRRGLTIVFSVPHVAGDTMQAYLPFAEIKDVLNSNGPLGALIR